MLTWWPTMPRVPCNICDKGKTMVTIQGETIRDVMKQLGLNCPWEVKVEKCTEGYRFRAMISDPKLEKLEVVKTWAEVAALMLALTVDIQSAEAAKQG